MKRNWNIRIRWLGLLACLVAFAVPSLAFAGGWAVITLDELPQNITIGQPVVIGMTALQHGETPMQMEQLMIEAQHQETGQEVTFEAKPQGSPGHYQAELLFPEAGRWGWGVASGLMPMLQPLPVLEVAGEMSAPAASRASPFNALQGLGARTVLLGVSALVVLAAGFILVLRSQDRRKRLLAGAGSVVLCGVLVFAMFTYTSAQAQQEKNAEQVSADAVTGRQLFLAKGCVVCHTNNRAITNSAQYGIDFGPNLSKYSNEPSYLRQFLANPRAVKATSKMPDLNLSQDEIEALVSFINNHD